jgi:glycosyl transferase family 87
MASGLQEPLLKCNILGVGAAALCALAMWFYVNHILVPYQRAEAEAHQRPRGNLSDLYPRWFGSRELLLHHRNPYTADITREIQIGYYGRALDPSLPGDPRDKQGFAYPVYVAFLLAPTLGMPFDRVAMAFKCGLLLATVASVLLWLRAVTWRLSRSGLLIVILLALGSFPVVQGFKLQQLSLLVASILAAACALLVSGNLFVSGILLAVATIKPQLVLPMVSVLLLWTVGNWRRRQMFFWGFALTMLLLLAASEFALPGWFRDFLSATGDYRKYAGGRSMLQVMLSERWGLIVSVVLAAVVAVVAWRFRKEEASSKSFSLTIAFTLAVTVIIIPMFAPYNYVLLLPGLLAVARDWMTLWKQGIVSRLALVLTTGAVVWPWLACLGLGVAWLTISRLLAQAGWWLPLYTSAKLPTPLVGLFPLGLLLSLAWRGEACTNPAVEPLHSET